MKKIYIFTLVALFTIFLAKSVSAIPVIFSEGELETQFAKVWGPADVTITDIPGPGARFDFTGLSGSGTGIGDDYEVSPLAGGVGTHNGDFTGYTEYPLVFTNVGANPVTVSVFMNTGWTGGNNPARDTYWQSFWTYIGVGETKTATLDFSSCGLVWNAVDDPNPAWRYPDGTGGHPIHRLDEVSRIGFQVLGNGSGSIEVEPVPEPATLILMACGLIGLTGYVVVRRKKR
jgi:hypothetical protein